MPQAEAPVLQDSHRIIDRRIKKIKNKFDRICRTYFFVFAMMSEEKNFCDNRKMS